VRGSVIVSFNSETHQLETGYLRIFDAAVDVVQLAPHDPFDAPGKNVRELLLFDPKTAPFRRIKIGGQILHGHAGDFFVMDGTNGLRVTTKGAAEFQLGDLVEVVGFLELGGPAPALKEAVARKTGQAPLPEPTRITMEPWCACKPCWWTNGTILRKRCWSCNPGSSCLKRA
jgi:hypothetical protein